MKRFLITAVAFLSVVSAAQALTIDDFVASPPLSQECSNGDGQVWLGTGYSKSGSVGGFVTLQCLWGGGEGRMSADVNGSNLTKIGFGSQNQDVDVSGQARFEWNGSNVVTPTNFQGLYGINGLDLTQDRSGTALPADSFIIETAKFDCGLNSLSIPIDATIKITVFDSRTPNGSRFASLAYSFDCSIPNPSAPRTIVLKFADFVNSIPSQPVDFKHIGAIRLDTSASPSGDLNFGKFHTNGSCPNVPNTEGVGCTPTPTPTSTPTFTSTPTITPTVTPTRTAAPTEVKVQPEVLTPTPTPTVSPMPTVRCIEENQTSTISALSDKADEFIANAKFFLEKVIRSDPKFAKANAAAIKKINVELKKKIVTLPVKTLNCVLNTLCTEVSVSGSALADIQNLNSKLYRIAITTLNKPIITGGKCHGTTTECVKRTSTATATRQKLTALVKRLYRDMQKLEASYPKTQSSCQAPIVF